MAGFTHRVATLDDLDALRRVMHRSIESLQTGFLTPEQVRVSHNVMGLDSQLVADGTYFVIEDADPLKRGRIAGCHPKGASCLLPNHGRGVGDHGDFR